MKKKSLRILSLIVAIVMVVAMLPLSALADETNEREVGVVVYGSELTSLLTGIEQLRKTDNYKDVPKASIENLLDLAQNIGTKMADGSGISVPDVDLVILDEDLNEVCTMSPTSLNIFTQTTEAYIPFQDNLETALTEIKNQLDKLIEVMDAHGAGWITEPVSGMGTKFTDISSNLGKLADNLMADLAKFTGLEGTAYRTYVADKKLTIGKTYYVRVKGFTDTDSEGNAITRDGYILYNDGLKEEGSGYNTMRTFPFEVAPKRMLIDHDIQFVGPKNGITGQLKLPEELDAQYNNAATTLNDLINNLNVLKERIFGDNEQGDTEGTDKGWWDKLKGSVTGLISDATDLFAKITNTEDLKNWFAGIDLTKFSLPTTEGDNSSYGFEFHGLWCAEYDAGFAFQNVDVVENPIGATEEAPGAAFLMVNRDEVIDILEFMIDLGKDTFSELMKAAFGQTEYNGVTYDSLIQLHTQLINTSEEGQINLDFDKVKDIVSVYIGVIARIDIFNRVKEAGLHIPAVLKAEADENGVVTFSKNSNITLSWLLDLVPVIKSAYEQMNLGDKLNISLLQVYDYFLELDEQAGASDALFDMTKSAVNTLIYPFAQRLGLVGPKMASGYYVMFQYKSPANYMINPFAYTMKVTWENERWVYATVADLGILTPYFAEGLYDFVRGTTFEGTMDKILGTLTRDNTFNYVTKVFDEEVSFADLTDDATKSVMAVFNAFLAKAGFQALNLDTVFANTPDFIKELNTYMFENGNSARNIMIFLNKQAKKAKSVYAGELTPTVKLDELGNTVSVTYDNYWNFYNLDSSPTLTATKLINKTTESIAAAIAGDSKHVTTQRAIVTKTGEAVSKIVNTIGNKIEEQTKVVSQKLKDAAKSVASKLFTAVTDFAKNAVSNLFSNIGNLFSRSMITFNA